MYMEDFSNQIKLIHDLMEHPGMNRLYKFLERRMSSSGLKEMVQICVKNCSICARIKPHFVKRPQGRVIQATKPWQRLAIYIVGPKLSATRNKYLFTVVDERSKYPFAFPVPDITA